MVWTMATIRPNSDAEKALLIDCETAHQQVKDILSTSCPDKISLPSEAITQSLSPLKPSSAVDSASQKIVDQYLQANAHPLVKDLLKGAECPDQVQAPTSAQLSTLNDPSSKQPNNAQKRKKSRKN